MFFLRASKLMGSKKLNEADIQARLPSFIKIKENSYINCKVKSVFIDSEFGEWEALVHNVLKGGVHPIRARGNQIKKITLNPEEIEKKLPDFIKLDRSSYKNTYTKARFIDLLYGEFWADASNVVRGALHPQRARANMIKKRTLTEEEVLNRLKNYPNISIKIDTYKNVNEKALFIDKEYGEFWCLPSNVFNGNRHPKYRYDKMRKTLMERYGVLYNVHIPGVARKISLSSKRTEIKTHWKSGNDLICQGKLEKSTVEYLNENKIDFEWQIPFTMPCGKRYTIDLYLPQMDLYVEIKGYFIREINRTKWEWFHETYPNSELWMEPKLRELGIIKLKKSKYWEKPS